ncbi:hypothetical protein EVAR_56751_1 [Eumeta japonica]|uniref:Uncharacterized protein n=1 Tax=Eumeta variegata TaxID=151549 RepID=A0A4C1XRC8_EUMVA|nr:hypothetical protein EVAR_56751_1 [Eumeta japonica]
MVTVFAKSDHGAIKRRPRVLLRFVTRSSERAHTDLTADPGDTIATTKEEEWVTRKKSEVTTTRQIATRVKRELLLEDGRILSDSGPKISTSVNEDTHTTNFQQSEHRVPEDQQDEGRDALTDQVDGAVGPITDTSVGAEMAPIDSKVVVSSRVVANPDGKVRESKDRRVLTRNVTERHKEIEERFHMGDTTHEVSDIQVSLRLCIKFRSRAPEVARRFEGKSDLNRSERPVVYTVRELYARDSLKDASRASQADH